MSGLWSSSYFRHTFHAPTNICNAATHTMPRNAVAECRDLLSGIDDMRRRLDACSCDPEPELIDALETCLQRMRDVYTLRLQPAQDRDGTVSPSSQSERRTSPKRHTKINSRFSSSQRPAAAGEASALSPPSDNIARTSRAHEDMPSPEPVNVRHAPRSALRRASPERRSNLRSVSSRGGQDQADLAPTIFFRRQVLLQRGRTGMSRASEG